jgi:ppGpp synthetase/RelA/SpoT-type nucleotidyltranferase
MGLSAEQLTKEYLTKKNLYEQLTNEITKQINVLINNQDIKLATPIECRVKTLDSVLEKCDRYQLSLNNISEMNDIAGMRIVVLFKRDIEKVCNIVIENFNIIRQEDVTARLSENQFGYGSIHFEVTPRNEWLSVPSLKPLKGLVLEIQLRTASQNIWAASSHILQYKKEKDVPQPLLRTINRAAALLEVVDLEFERVLIEREAYLENINESGDEDINTDSLKLTLDKYLPENNKGDNENYADLLDDILHMGINSTTKLIEVIDKHKSKVMKSEEEYVKMSKEEKSMGSHADRIAKGVFFTHVGLVRKALGYEYGEKYNKYIKEKLNNIFDKIKEKK